MSTSHRGDGDWVAAQGGERTKLMLLLALALAFCRGLGLSTECPQGVFESIHLTRRALPQQRRPAWTRFLCTLLGRGGGAFRYDMLHVFNIFFWPVHVPQSLVKVRDESDIFLGQHRLLVREADAVKLARLVSASFVCRAARPTRSSNPVLKAETCWRLPRLVGAVSLAVLPYEAPVPWTRGYFVLSCSGFVKSPLNTECS